MDNTENENKIYLKNLMDDIVIEKVKASLELYKDDMCKCDKCFYDICAIALNALQPQYITTNAGEMYGRASRLDRMGTINISVEVTRAIEIVRKKPSH